MEGTIMRRRGFFLSSAVLLLLIPLLLLTVTYEDLTHAIIKEQAKRSLMERGYLQTTNIQDDLKNAVGLSLKQAYLTLNEYVIKNGFVNNASSKLEELMIWGTIDGAEQSQMANITLDFWFKNTVEYLSSIGMLIIPNDSGSLFSEHFEILIGPLDSFHVAVRVRLVNITITDASGIIRFHGNVPQEGFIYYVMDVMGFEDPFIVRKLNGLYTRIIQPCEIPFPGENGYYDVDKLNNAVEEQCYVGIENESLYPSILERFEGSTAHHPYYLEVSKTLREGLNIKDSLPIGLITFMVPSMDSALRNALEAMGASLPNSTSVDYYYLRCAIDGTDCIEGYPLIGSEYEDLRLDNVTAMELFNTTDVLNTG